MSSEFKCGICARPFATFGALRHHYTRMHDGGPAQFVQTREPPIIAKRRQAREKTAAVKPAGRRVRF